jgi:Protein of unknown function (DUF1059)
VKPPSRGLAWSLLLSCTAVLASLGVIVDKVLVCECGFEARAPDEEALADKVRRHASEAHGMTLSQDEALMLAFQAELYRDAPTAIARETTAPEQKEEE